MSFVAFLKLLEHHIQGQIVKHKVARILVELTKHPKRCVVVSVNKRQVFYVQKRQNVCSVAFVNRNARISCRKYVVSSWKDNGWRIFYSPEFMILEIVSKSRIESIESIKASSIGVIMSPTVFFRISRTPEIILTSSLSRSLWSFVTFTNSLSL